MDNVQKNAITDFRFIPDDSMPMKVTSDFKVI
jgi:hypothetical protein